MANPFDLFGIVNGVGPSLTGQQNVRAADTQNQLSLQSLFNQELANRTGEVDLQQKQLNLDEARALSPSKIALGIRDSRDKISEMDLKDFNRLGDMALQLGSHLDRVPPEQRQQVLGRIGQQVPEIAQNPIFLNLMQTDPTLLPNALKQFGTDIQLETGDYMRKMGLQKAKSADELVQENVRQKGAMDRTQLEVSGANARAGASNANQLALERMRIEAGKYNSKKAAQDPVAMVSKLGYEKAAVMYDYLAREAKDPAEKAELAANAEMMRRLNLEAKAAGVRPGSTIDSSNNIIPNNPYGTQAPPPPMNLQGLPRETQSSPSSIPAGLPQGTQANGDGTFTLPDGRRVRPKK